MTYHDNRRGFGQRINNWLDEPPGETFKHGKWRFWFPMLIGFSALNAILTAMIFGSSGQLQTYLGAIMLSIGALLAWSCIGTLHYSDSHDVRMARGVAALDSITLVCVIAHFCFLLWVQGHVWTLQAREAEYKAATAAYNEKAEKVQADNARIAAAAERIATETTKAERLRNDTAYQQRKAAEAGARVGSGRSGSAATLAPSLSTSPIELEKPEKPKESSTDFLTYWDLWVRLANFGELALAAITFIYIRNRSAKFNARIAPQYDAALWPDELDIIENGPTRRRAEYAIAPQKAATHVSLKRDDTAPAKKATQDINREGLRRLRETLRLVGFHSKSHFKVDPKDDYLWLRQFRSEHGEARQIAQTKAALPILDDAATMEQEQFRFRLEKFLREREFEI